MKQPATIHLLCRRLLLVTVIGALVLVFVLTAWRGFVQRVGGHFDYVPADARWVLSTDAQTLVAAAFADVAADAAIVDYHVTAISTGHLGNHEIVNNSYYRQDRSGAAGPLAWVETQLRLAGAGVADIPAAAIDGRYVSRLLSQIRAMPIAYKTRVLAQGWRYDNTGERDAAATYTHVSNDYVWWLAQQAPTAIVPVVSIHPYRRDAQQQLAYWADKGVQAVAWWPLRQNIDLRDPRSLIFYAALAKHDMTLQLPVGAVTTAQAADDGRIPITALRAPLLQGATVVARAQAGAGVVEQLLRLARGDLGERLRISLAGVFADGAANGVLQRLLQQPELATHLRYASNYPLSAMASAIDLDSLAAAGFISMENVQPLREIHGVNPLLFVYVLARTVHLPETTLRLPVSVFVGGQTAAGDAAAAQSKAQE